MLVRRLLCRIFGHRLTRRAERFSECSRCGGISRRKFWWADS